MDALNSSTVMPPASTVTPKSYLDFDGLGQLKGQARQDAKGATRETAQQFEALFLQMMMKSMREASVKSDLNESSAKDTFEGMFDKEVSVQMAKRNTLGIADMLVKNMTPPEAAIPSTAAMLEARGAAASPAIPLQASQSLTKRFSLKAPLPAALTLPRTGAMPLTPFNGLIDRSSL
jgi:flagellar protein FlgJ